MDVNAMNILIGDICDNVIDTNLRSEYVMCRQPVLVDAYDSVKNLVRVTFPSDYTKNSGYYYPNKTGRVVGKGEKLYLVYQYGSIYQGWVEDMKSRDIPWKDNFNTVIVSHTFTPDGTIQWEEAFDTTIDMPSGFSYANSTLLSSGCYRSDGNPFYYFGVRPPTQTNAVSITYTVEILSNNKLQINMNATQPAGVLLSGSIPMTISISLVITS